MKSHNIHKILVPTDFSMMGNNALRYAQLLAKFNEAEVEMLHVIQKDDAGSDITVNGSVSAHLEFMLIEAKLRMKKLSEFITGKSLPSIAQFGAPSDNIVQAAQENQSDLIVLGYYNDRDGSELSTRIMQIIRNAPCPIIAIQPEFEKHLFKRIVIPIRNKPFMMDKIQYILPVAKSLKAVVHLAVFYPDVADTERNRQVSHIFNNAMSLLRENGINTSYTAKTQGRYVRDTIQIAKEKEADIVVILANQSNFFERLVGIADEEKFMRLAHIPVMTIPAEHTGLRLMKSVSDWHIAPRESQAIPAMAFDNTPSV